MSGRKINRKNLSIILIICMIMILTSCNTNESNSGDDFPVKIGYSTIEYKPEKVVVLSDNIADIMIASEFGDVIVGKSDECTQEELKDIPSVGVGVKPSVSEIVMLYPDFVIANYDINEKVYEEIISRDIKVFKMLPAESDEELISLYENVCSMMIGKQNGKEQGASTATKILNDIDDYTLDIPVTVQTPTVCYLINLTDSVITSDMYQSEILKSAGGENIAVKISEYGNIPYTIDNVIQANPDYIFCDVGLKDDIMTDSKFKNMTAVKNENVFEYADELMFRQGKTLIETVMTLSKDMYSNMDSETNELTTEEILLKYNITINDDINIQIGDNNDYVLAVQERLQMLGYWGDNDITGYYGEISEEAVQQFKINNGLDTAQSGINAEEFKVLFSESAIPFR